ncbi:MAG: hypothetical protein E7610_04420 [Ruminococcaceae bacterium]|nr:hypothetical protein [Oscillospiraceae bacterium]
MLESHRIVTVRMIAYPEPGQEILHRVEQMCRENAMTYEIRQNQAYWKIPEKVEITLMLGDSPTWNYGKWSEIFGSLFTRSMTIEWDGEEDVRLFSFPPVDSQEIWVEMNIPSACFWPKPSKDVRH